VRRRVAARPVARGANDAGAEIVHPDPVDEDPGGQRIVAAGDGLGQLEAAAAVAEWLSLVAR
jgi:hypothetical protein